MSAGTGVAHSEYNLHESQNLRLLQIWILPPTKNLQPIYGSHRYKEDELTNKLLNIVSSVNGNSKIKIRQNVNIFVSKLDEKNVIEFELKDDKQIYFVQIEGSSLVNQIILSNGDAMELYDENLSIEAMENSHFLFIEMYKDR